VKAIVALIVGLALASCGVRSGAILTDASYVPVPHAEPVCLMKSPLPSSIKHRVVGKLEAFKREYGSVEEILVAMANDARKMGAHAVVNQDARQRPGFFAWVRPGGYGTAVRLDNPAELNCIAAGGVLR
jgi:uncharacterized protein YbjQ (UPF0145 family)